MPGQRSVYILPGFAEGRWHTKLLMDSLRPLGYTEAVDSTQADVLVTHSAGCFFLPNSAANRTAVLINPPFWPGKPIIFSITQKIWRDFRTAAQRGKLGFWARKVTWNWIYIVFNLLRVFRIARFASQHNFHEALRGIDAAIIRNDDDAWLTPRAQELIPNGETFRFYHIPGEHEDCWVYPDEHARLIHQAIIEGKGQSV